MHKHYTFTLADSTQKEYQEYQQDLVDNRNLAGEHFKQALADLNEQDLKHLPLNVFIERLINTKEPQIFAEMSIYGDGRDWTQRELRLLGAIGCAVPCVFYDDGLHHQSNPHQKPFNAHLLFVPGPLLTHRSGNSAQACDYDLVTLNGELNQDQYTALIRKRLLPLLVWANQVCQEQSQPGLITVPGIGCGVFAGRFRGQLEAYLEKALITLLEEHALSHISALYFGTYRSLSHQVHLIHSQQKPQAAKQAVITCPLIPHGHAQLCSPQTYNQEGFDFNDHLMFSVVAWDHVSWPGNDYYVGSRATDDGVKGAATDVIYRLTGVEGHYDAKQEKYVPPKAYRNWKEVVLRHQIKLDYSSAL